MILEVKGLSKKYGRLQILDNVSFEAASGAIVGFVGKNGCGKTTLLSILAGVMSADKGVVSIDGHELSLRHRGVGEIAGYVPQVNPLLDSVSVSDNIKLYAKTKELYHRGVERFNLGDILKRKVGKLSGGMKRRVAIACALVNEPPILIMDEPTAALDIEYKALIHEEMKRYSECGGLLILVTHEREEIDMCNVVFNIENGAIARMR